MNKSKKSIGLVFLLVLIFTIGFLYYSNVNNEITDRDKIFIEKIVKKRQNNFQSYNDELEFIQFVQSRVLTVAPLNKGLPEKVEREPEQLYKNRYGLCYDRSRVIEKILRSKGFETRHIFVFSIEDSDSKIDALLKQKNPSHAISEVKTSQGWIFIDSNDYFLGIDKFSNPISIQLLKEKGFNSIVWHPYNNLDYSVIYRRKFDFVYGLYSRHGKFYPPYNFVPDISWEEFFDNF